MKSLFEQQLHHRPAHHGGGLGCLRFGLDGIAGGIEPGRSALHIQRSYRWPVSGLSGSEGIVRLLDQWAQGPAPQTQPSRRGTGWRSIFVSPTFLDRRHFELWPGLPGESRRKRHTNAERFQVMTPSLVGLTNTRLQAWSTILQTYRASRLLRCFRYPTRSNSTSRTSCGLFAPHAYLHLESRSGLYEQITNNKSFRPGS